MINKKLKQRRIACGFTQNQLAEASGINIRSLSCYEQDAEKFNKASVTAVMKIADCLGCTVEDIIDRKSMSLG